VILFKNCTTSMKGFFFNNKSFLILYLVSISTLIPILIFVPKGNIHLYINNIHSVWADYFFKYLTNLGSGLVVVIVSVIYLFISFRKTLILAVSGIICGILVQIFKRLIFSEIVRPSKFFEGVSHLHLVDGVQMLSYNSFPSGHSATIFALCLCLAAFSGLNRWKVVLFFIAVLVAFSRIYLSQHFLSDTYFGSMIGVLIASITYIRLNNINAVWLDRDLLDIHQKSKSK
jgi:membrane-associated phospholipid phosphatase